MDWFLSSKPRPLKDVEWYQRKVLSFLYSAEGRDDFRCLNIPLAQLGFYSPMHFISCIPMEMCEPYKNDKLFLASYGELRRGDKVLLIEKGTEGLIRSAIFKGRRIGRDGDPEIILDGHRQSYTEEEVVPYKAHLREHLGTALIPESNYVISPDGILSWDEPTWEPGQEVFYNPEKRWATVLSHGTNARGREFATIKMEQSNTKKEKIINVAFDDLIGNSTPIRVPQRVHGSESSELSAMHTLDDVLKRADSKEASSTDTSSPKLGSKMETTNGSTSSGSNGNAIYATINPVGKNKGTEKEFQECSIDMHSEPSDHAKIKTESCPSSKPAAVLRKKSTKKQMTRPVTEYYQESSAQSPHARSSMYQESEAVKSKSFNNLNGLPLSDDEMEPLELEHYTNSLRSSARKIIQKQMAQEAEHRATSLKLRPVAIRPHVAEIFAMDNGKMTKNVQTSTTKSYSRPIISSQLAPNKMSTISSRGYLPYRTNNLSKSSSQPDIVRSPTQSPMMAMNSTTDEVDQSRRSRPPITAPTQLTPREIIEHYNSQNPVPPVRTKRAAQKQGSQPPQQNNPLDFNFLPLSSSELVKRQLTVLNRVLHQPLPKPIQRPVLTEYNNKSSSPVLMTQSYNGPACISSDSSSHDNDSGRGSSRLSETYKSTEEIIEDVSSKRTLNSSNGMKSVNFLNKDSENREISNRSGMASGNISPTRRYTKNKAAVSKHPMQKYNGSAKEEEEEQGELVIPQPFGYENIAAISGYGKGIQGALNSSYADATLFAIFSCSNIFDRDLLTSKPGQVERGVQKDVRKILRQKIVTPLRTNAYCKSENVTHLREAMLPLSSKMHSPLMDAEEFLCLLFDSALNTENFIEFSNGTKEYLHQIIARPKDRSKSQTVQFMFETSLQTSSLKFRSVPRPALFLCMPRCKGRLVYYDAIIPSLQLNITKLLDKGPKKCVCEKAATLECVICHSKNGHMALDYCQMCKELSRQVHLRSDHSPVLIPKAYDDEMLDLHSIVCTRGNRYVSFVKISNERLSPWLFFDSLAGEYPEVTYLEDFGKWLDSLEKQPGHYREFAKLHPLLKRIMTDSHIYIYSKMHNGLDDAECTESLVI